MFRVHVYIAVPLINNDLCFRVHVYIAVLLISSDLCFRVLVCIAVCVLAGIDMVFLQAGLCMSNTAVYSLHKTSTRQVCSCALTEDFSCCFQIHYFNMGGTGLKFEP